MRRLLTALVYLGMLFTAPCFALATHPQVGFQKAADAVEILINGKPVATYVYRDPEILRPYIKDVRTMHGIQVTRSMPPVEGVDATDHATMHPGVWLAFGDLGGADFWRNRARVEHVDFAEEPKADLDGGQFTVRNRYLSGERLVCNETCKIAVWALAEELVLVWDSEFSAPTEFYFGDQEEMGFGVRVATPLAVKNGGTLTNSEGRNGEKEVWGRVATWCDASGTINGRRVGMLVVPDPMNFRKSWFHARDYGLIVANPFGLQAFTRSPEPSRVTVPAGEKFRLRFAVVVHEGDIDLEAAASSATTELNASR
jgi:hypothetical protein